MKVDENRISPTSEEEAVYSLMKKLSALEGTWKGKGFGIYPTIDDFIYAETLQFTLDISYPLFHYEQRTWLLPDEVPGHWESGFIRPLPGGYIEISNSQDGGRVEVLRGSITSAGTADADLELTFHSVALAHDPRLVETKRIFQLTGSTLCYTKYMATNTTPEPKLIKHLEAELQFISGS